VTVTLTRLPEVHSPELANHRDIVVALPPSYTSSASRYPVLYLHDGQNLFDPAESYAGDWELLDTLAAYARSIVETLKPLVDREFRTRPEPEATSIGGSSLGGLLSLYAFLAHPLVFGAAAALSPSLWFARGAIFRWTRPRAAGGGRIYLDAGLREPLRTARDARRMRDLLVANGYEPGSTLAFVEDPEGGHDEASWARRFRAAFPFVVAGHPLPEGAADAA
jgi:predicted alpha/beta superfamily hydrolase